MKVFIYPYKPVTNTTEIVKVEKKEEALPPKNLIPLEF